MSDAGRHLRLVPSCASTSESPSPDLEDLGLTVLIFLVAALPLASALAGVGRWDEASLGLGTLGVLFTGRELMARVAATRRASRTRSRTPAQAQRADPR